MILVFNMAQAGMINLTLIKAEKIIKTKTITLPTSLSEKLWQILPIWVGKTPVKLETVAITYQRECVTYSALRTVLSIINTLARDKTISIILLPYLKIGQSPAPYLKQSKTVFHVNAEYK